MLSVRIDGPSQLSLQETARPEVVDPGDAVLMVTTAAISAWDIDAYLRGDEGAVPGSQLAGIVVEIGADVTAVDIDDLVIRRIAPPSGDKGSAPVSGGHAEYVRVANANSMLVRTTAAAEERTALAGGAVAIGIQAAEKVLETAGDRPVMAWGCDAAVITALAWIKRKASAESRRFAFDHRAARATVAKTYGAESVALDDLAKTPVRVALLGSPPHGPSAQELAHALADDATVIVLDPAADVKGEFPGGVKVVTCDWPSLEQVKRAALAVQLRQIDLTPLVSHVMPLDEAEDAYRRAAEAPPGTQAVLLKP